MLDRRAFLSQASSLGLVIGGTALIGCKNENQQGSNNQQPQAASRGSHNPDSRLDTSLAHPRTPTSATGAAVTPNVAFQRFDPILPPLPAGRTIDLHWHAREAPVRISESTVVAAWTFEGNSPGPIIHCRVGDTINFTLTNDVGVPHSMDFHAAQIDPKVAFRSAAQGQSVSYTFKPKYAGAFLYHCGTAPVLMHLGSGMFGAIIVSPAEPLPPAKEFVLIQSEMYLSPVSATTGIRAFDYQRMLATVPDFVVFNGRPDQYINEPMRVNTGDRVRFWVANAGPTHPCNFHIVGEQFDTVYLGAPPGNAIHGVQTFDVAAGGGMCFELTCDVPGEFPVVNHGFGHGQKGAIGILAVGQG